MKTAIKPNQSTKPLLYSLSVAMTSALLMGVTALPSRADITFYDVAKGRFYTQNSDNQPPTPSFFGLDARLESDNPNDFDDVFIGGVTPSFEFFSLTPVSVGPTDAFYRSPIFTDESIFDATFPNGSSFNFDFLGGNLDGETASLILPNNLTYPAEIPFLTGGSFSALQGFDPSQSLTLTFNGFTLDPNADFNNIFFGINQTFDTEILRVFSSGALPNTATSVLIPANTLQPNTDYFFNLDYVVGSQTGLFENASGFNAGGFGDFRSTAIGDFTTGGFPVGTTPENPFLPILNDPSNPNGFSFLGVPVIGGEFFFFDPDVAVGYDYAVTGGLLFASVLIPNTLPNGDSNFILELPGFGNFPLISGTPFDLLAVNPLGFSNFRISDIDTMEMIDPTDPLAFVTGLSFTNNGTVNVTQNPIVVNIPDPVTTPEPSSLLSFGLLGLGFGIKKLKK
jgi:hypothetical protein